MLYKMLNNVSEIVALTSVIVMLLGFIFFCRDFLVLTIKKTTKQLFLQNAQVLRCKLGSYLLMALELIIISDVISTIITRTRENFIMLASIVVIRTLISYFLRKEISEVK
jgi:uncharacterized membrane protein